MKLFVPADAPGWLTAFARSVEDKFRSLLTAPLRLMGLATAELPAPADFSQGLVYDLATDEILYSTGAAWQRLFGSGHSALDAVAALVPTADAYVYFTGPDTASLGTVTGFGRSLLDDADAAAARTTLGAAAASHAHAIADVAGLGAALDAKLDDGQASAFGLSLLDDADAAAGRTTLGAAAASHGHAVADVTGLGAALDAKLDDSQATAFGLSLVDDADAAAARTTLGLGTAATEAIGTSGSAVPKLDGGNLWSGAQGFDAPFSASSGGAVYASFFSSTVAAFGSGGGTASVGNFQFRGANAAGTNIAGGNLIFGAGRGTGSGAAATLIFQTPTPLGSGSAQQANATRLTIGNVGIDVVGEARCDTLRIDATPTAGVVANTHTVPVNLNGTVYQMLVKA